MQYKLLFSVFIIFVTSASIKAQQDKLSAEQEEKCKQDLCRALLINHKGISDTRFSPQNMQILSFSFSSTGKIARVKGHYASAPKDSWIKLFYEEDLEYAMVYSDDPKNIITPWAPAPSGAMQPYNGPRLNEIKILQQALTKTLQKEPEQDQFNVVKKEEEETSGAPGKNGASAAMSSKDSPNEYKIGGNLYVKFPGNYPAGYSPEWNFVTYNFEAPTYDENFHDDLGSYKNTNRVRLTEINGNAGFIFNGNYSSAIIDIPGGKFVLSSSPKTFTLRDFKSPAPTTGTITLSADEQGTITASFKLEFYSGSNKLLTRVTSEKFNAPIIQKPKDALVKLDDAKYNKVLEELIQVHYEGWRFDKMYKPNSMRDSKVELRDALGRPTKISAIYSNSDGGNSGFTVLFSEGIPYAIFEDATTATKWEKTCIMPYKKVNGQNIAFSATEKLKYQNLQRKYLLDLWITNFKKTPKESNQLKFLVPAESFAISTQQVQIDEKETISDDHGNPIGEISVPKTVNSSSSYKIPGIKNTYTDYTIVKDYGYEETDNTLSIVDYSFWLRPGQIIDAFKVNPELNNIEGMNFMILLQTPDDQTESSKIANGQTKNHFTSRHIFGIKESETIYAFFCRRDKSVNLSALLVSRYYHIQKNVCVNDYGDQFVFNYGKSYDPNPMLTTTMDYTVRINNQKFADSLMQDLRNTAQKLDDATYTFDGKFLITVTDEVRSGINYKRFSFTNNSDGHRSIIAKKTASNILEITSRTSSSGIFVKAGDKIILKAEGKVRLAPAEWVKEGGPDGTENFKVFGNLTSYKPGALIGKIGPNGEWFLVGSSLSFTANARGELILAINDVNPDDNSGSFFVTYSINN